MFLLKKLFISILNRMHEIDLDVMPMFKVVRIECNHGSLSNGNAPTLKTYDTPVKDGYTCVGIAGYKHLNKRLTHSVLWVDANKKVNIYPFNMSGGSLDATSYIYLLYIKNNYL